MSNRQNLDRRPLDREQARRRFAGTRVDARNVDFSDHIGGTRGSYRTRSSRRRRRARRADIEGEDLADSSDSEEEETVSRKIARLRREAEEVRLELDRLEAAKHKDADGDFVDSLEQQQQQQQQRQNPDVDTEPERDQVQELSRLLDGLSSKTGLGGRKSAEDQFLSRLSVHSNLPKHVSTTQSDSGLIPLQPDADSKPSAISAVAVFADRLTALESALGVSTASADSPTTTILSTLERLSTQINTIHTTLNPKDANGATPTTTSTPTTYNPAFLESISAKLRTLTRESAELDQSRRKARDTLDELREKRTGLLISASVQHGMQPRRGYGGTGGGGVVGDDDDKDRDRGQETIGELNRPDAESQALTSKLFLEDQSARITALYQTLPSIQRLQPLLPVVLERLRALNVVHVGAAEAKNSLDEVEKRQAELKAEMAQWREAVDGVETGIKDLELTMKDNVKVVGGMVASLEERMVDLDKGAKAR